MGLERSTYVGPAVVCDKLSYREYSEIVGEVLSKIGPDSPDLMEGKSVFVGNQYGSTPPPCKLWWGRDGDGDIGELKAADMEAAKAWFQELYGPEIEALPNAEVIVVAATWRR